MRTPRALQSADTHVERVVLEQLGHDLRWLREEPFERRFGIVNQLQEGWIGVGHQAGRAGDRR